MEKTGKTGYLDIKANVLKRIRDNTWPPNTIIPGEIELAGEFGCARATVNRAMRELVEDGFLDRKRKAGTRVKSSPTRQAKFVIPLIREEIESRGEEYCYVLEKREIHTAADWLCARLGLKQGSEMLHLQCIHHAAGSPFQFEDRWINLRAVPTAAQADFKTTGPNEWLVNEVPFTDVELTFSANSANKQVAGFLSAAEGTALFTIERITWLEKMPVTYAKLSFSAGYQINTRL